MTDSTNSTTDLKMEGEGSREGSRRFQDAQHKFAQSGQIESRAKEAADALEGDEGAELEKARKAAAQGKTASQD